MSTELLCTLVTFMFIAIWAMAGSIVIRDN